MALMPESLIGTDLTAEYCIKKLLKVAKPSLLLNSFAGGYWKKQSWKQRLSALNHFRWPHKYVWVLYSTLPITNSANSTIRFKRRGTFKVEPYTRIEQETVYAWDNITQGGFTIK